jgi:ribosome-binding ATPase YchF (GTP1/OBG family)
MSGVELSGLIILKILNLITFFTAGEEEVAAWAIKEGTTAKKAAEKIHSDIAKGFVKAEVVSFEDFISAGSFAKARAQGNLRLEGRDYVVKDGDIIHFRFNVA